VANPPPTTTHGYVSIVNTGTRKELAAIGSASGFPVYTASDPNSGLIYSGDSGGHTVSIYSASALVGAIEVGESLPHQVAVDPGNDHLVATNVKDLSGQWVGVYDLRTRQPIALDSLGAGAEPHGISIDAGRHLAFVSSVTTKKVTVISTATGAVMASFSVAGNLTNINVLDAKRERLYVVSNNNPQAVIGFDGISDKLLGSATVDSQPWGLGVESWNGRVLAVLPADNAISVVDPSHWKELAHVPVGKCPFQIAVDQSRRLAYVSDQADNAVTVVDLRRVDAATRPRSHCRKARKHAKRKRC
jgi:YVTN family beta-propeller protein